MALLIAKIAPSFCAQLRLEIPLFTSQNNMLSNRRCESLLPSSTKPNPPLITSPQPTPPPLWMLTHVAPRKLSPITLCTAMSAVNRSEEHTSELQSRPHLV